MFLICTATKNLMSVAYADARYQGEESYFARDTNVCKLMFERKIDDLSDYTFPNPYPCSPKGNSLDMKPSKRIFKNCNVDT